MSRLLRPLLLCLLTLCAWSTAARADTLADTFKRGSTAFARAQYDEAVREFETLLEAGVDDPDVHFNLANSYAAQRRYGQAIRYFEKALLLAPRDAEAQKSLRAARDALGQRQAIATGEAIVASRPPLAEAVFSSVTENQLSWGLLILAWTASASALALFFVRAETARLSLGICTVIALLGAVASGVGLSVRSDDSEEGHRALVIRETAKIYQGPDESSQTAKELVEGQPLRTLGHDGSFTRVRVADGTRGFVRTADIGEI